MANNNMNQNQSKSDKSRTTDKNESSRSGSNNPGNFKNNPEKAAEAGRKGGEARSGEARR